MGVGHKLFEGCHLILGTSNHHYRGTSTGSSPRVGILWAKIRKRSYLDGDLRGQG